MALPSPDLPVWGRPSVRLAGSVLIIGHVLAVVTAPLAFQTQSNRGNSPSVEASGAPVRGYGEFLYLNRGYAFFAPDPGPSHLFQAAIGDPDQPDRLAEPVFPDLQKQWPRLLYHRHFMLAEYLHEIHHPPGPTEDLVRQDPEAANVWGRLRLRYEYVRQSFIRHLESTHPGQPVAIRRLEHMLPGFLEFFAHESNGEGATAGQADRGQAAGEAFHPMRLDDDQSYRVLMDGLPPGMDAVPAGAPGELPAVKQTTDAQGAAQASPGLGRADARDRSSEERLP